MKSRWLVWWGVALCCLGQAWAVRVTMSTADTSYVAGHANYTIYYRSWTVTEPTTWSWAGSSWSWQGAGNYNGTELSGPPSNASMKWQVRDSGGSTVIATSGVLTSATGWNWTFYAYGGAPPTSNTLYSWTHTLTNQSLLAETYRLTLSYTNGVSTNYTLSVLPGGNVNFSVEHTNAFSVLLERFTPGGSDDSGTIDMSDLWDTETGPVSPSATATNLGSSWSPVVGGSAGSANVWTGANAGALGARPGAITATSAGTRGTNFADAATATATSDSNQEKRFAELQSVLVQQDTRAADRAAIQAAQLLAGVDRVRDAVLSVGAHVGGALTNGTGTAYAPGSNWTSGTSWTVAAGSNLFRSLAPDWSPPSPTAPVLVFPLSALDSRMEDQEINFGTGTLGEWASVFRDFALLLVTLGFLFATLQLVGRFAGL